MAKFSKFDTVGMFKRAVAVAMILAMVVLSGCDDNTQDPVKKPTNSQNSSSSGNASGTESVVIDPVQGEISHTVSVVGVQTRDDDGEIAPETAITNLKDSRTGFLDAEADKLRQQILNTGNTEQYYKITGKKYYVSPGGSDANNGLSPESPLRTIDAVGTLSLEPGDAVLFERGSIFRMTQTINCKEGVIYGSYGKGNKPKLYGSGQNFAKAEWTPTQRKNIWKTSYIYDKAGNIIFDYGEVVGYMRQNIRGLTENYQFYQSEEDGFVYLYCDKGNPAKVYKSIEIASGVQFFTISGGVGDVTIDNICMLYSAAHGISGLAGNYDITVTNCEMGYVGGWKRETGRLGNAIQMWSGVEGFHVKNNWIYQTFDTAISWQGTSGSRTPAGKYTDIYIENNLLEYNHTDLEFWDEKAGLSNFVIKNNMFRFTQLGWGGREKDGGIRGFDGVIYGTTSDMNVTGKIEFINNTVDTPGGRLFMWDGAPEEIEKYWNFSGTDVYIKTADRFTNQIIRGVIVPGMADKQSFDATNQGDAEYALKFFDSTVKVTWK